MKRVVYSCSYVPPEYIAAHGFKAVRLKPSAGTGTLHHERAGICHYMLRFMEQAIASDAAAVVVSTLCDQMRRGTELKLNGGDMPVFLMHVPKTVDSVHALRYYRDEIKRMGRFMESLGGHVPSNEALMTGMLDFEAGRQQLLEARSRLSGSAFSRQLHAFQAGENAALLNTGVESAGSIPVAVLGGAVTQDDRLLFELLEQAGAAIVLDGTEGGERTLVRPFHRQRIQSNPFDELVEAYWEIPDVARRPNSSLFVWLKREIEARGVRGVVLLRNGWCDLWHGEVMRLREWLSVPLLDLDLDGESAPARNETRIEAFMEALS